jgi:hypothetical protein
LNQRDRCHILIAAFAEGIMKAAAMAQTTGTETRVPEHRQAGLPAEQAPDLADLAKQEQYRQAYRVQQARRSCPGCGDDGTLF